MSIVRRLREQKARVVDKAVRGARAIEKARTIEPKRLAEATRRYTEKAIRFLARPVAPIPPVIPFAPVITPVVPFVRPTPVPTPRPTPVPMPPVTPRPTPRPEPKPAPRPEPRPIPPKLIGYTTVRITSTPTGAMVRLPDAPRPVWIPTPITFMLTRGMRRFEFKKEGYETLTIRKDISGDEITIHGTLVRVIPEPFVKPTPTPIPRPFPIPRPEPRPKDERLIPTPEPTPPVIPERGVMIAIGIAVIGFVAYTLTKK